MHASGSKIASNKKRMQLNEQKIAAFVVIFIYMDMGDENKWNGNKTKRNKPPATA